MEKSEPKPEPQPSDVKTGQPRLPPEVGGPKGPEPTRYGDWEVKGRCTDF
jgi:hypothetical protein